MSITGELREWASIEVPYKYGHQLTAIADRIDAEHERQLEVLYHDMSDAEWVRLPLDADGVPWNVSDRDEDGNTVLELRLTSSGWCVTTDGGEFCLPSSYRHHHAPTVEDVLREMYAELDEVTALYVGEAIDSGERDRDEARIFAEYAAKLRLAGDAE